MGEVTSSPCSVQTRAFVSIYNQVKPVMRDRQNPGRMLFPLSGFLTAHQSVRGRLRTNNDPDVGARCALETSFQKHCLPGSFQSSPYYINNMVRTQAAYPRELHEVVWVAARISRTSIRSGGWQVERLSFGTARDLHPDRDLVHHRNKVSTLRSGQALRACPVPTSPKTGGTT